MEKYISIVLVIFLISVLFLVYFYIDNQKYTAFVECQEKSFVAPMSNELGQPMVANWNNLCGIILNHKLSKLGIFGN
jgi:flagellar biosynthesis/type III secretory pathway M-ring protein FliF/YscJ